MAWVTPNQSLSLPALRKVGDGLVEQITDWACRQEVWAAHAYPAPTHPGPSDVGPSWGRRVRRLFFLNVNVGETASSEGTQAFSEGGATFTRGGHGGEGLSHSRRRRDIARPGTVQCPLRP